MASLNGLASGIDCKITFIDINGNQNFQLIESFTASSEAPIPTQILMDGSILNPQLYQGWTGSFSYVRNGSVLDKYINANEANYNLGGDQIIATINQTISEPDGTLTKFQFINVAITLTDAGMYSGTEIVKQTVSFKASRRLTII